MSDPEARGVEQRNRGEATAAERQSGRECKVGRTEENEECIQANMEAG